MMAGRILTKDNQEFETAVWDGENRSGWQPLDDKVLVLMDEHTELTKGGIIVMSQIADRQTLAGITGVIVALGPTAFRWSDDLARAWTGYKPQPGDRVYVDRYSGQLVNGRDGRQYRLMSQSCVGAVEIAPEPAREPDPDPVPLPQKKGRRRV